MESLGEAALKILELSVTGLKNESYKLWFEKVEVLNDRKLNFSCCNISNFNMVPVTEKTEFGVVSSKFCPFNKLFKPGLDTLMKVIEDGEFDGNENPEIKALIQFLTTQMITANQKLEEVKRKLEDCRKRKDKLKKAKEKMKIGNKRKLSDEDYTRDSDIKTIMLSHVFKSLMPKKAIIVLDEKTVENRTSNGYIFCACSENCPEKIRLGNTCLGNKEVFHGRVDAVAGETLLQIINETNEENLDEENEDIDLQSDNEDDEGDNQSVNKMLNEKMEFKIRKKTPQASATLITFSFYKAKQYGSANMKCNLVPCLLYTPYNFKLLMNDPVKDLFLSSSIIDITDRKMPIIAVLFWCVLNYEKTLCSKYKSENLEHVVSNFQSKCKDLQIYREELIFGEDITAEPDIDAPNLYVSSEVDLFVQ